MRVVLPTSFGLPRNQSTRPAAKRSTLEAVRGQRRGENERLLRVIGDFARREIEPTAAGELAHALWEARGDLLAGEELERSAQGVATGEAEQCPRVAVGKSRRPLFRSMPDPRSL